MKAFKKIYMMHKGVIGVWNVTNCNFNKLPLDILLSALFVAQKKNNVNKEQVVKEFN